ncbi:DMT family transporter [Bowmanella dokdonensis]|uniref:DMT family transporter n=1 Tax=Bowmanella dokdonensis TaxID=751969 RepID=A0A939DP53_9ALTE|nr:DMT family transporter [Bowmanella dokdonensis]MBN7825700.1 DMT family transporter [Bowmanella dokdonensis]
MGWLSTLELILLAALWGASFLFMREGAPQFGPIALIALRTGVAALFLLPILLISRQQRHIFSRWRPILIVGLTNTAIPFCLFSYTTLSLAAGVTSILNATAPMFAAIIAFVWLKQKLTSVAMFGLLVGFGGVFVLTAGKEGGMGQVEWLPILAALGATCLYGFAANYTKAALAGTPSLAIATGSQIYSALALAPLAWLTWPVQTPQSSAWGQVLALGVACTGLAYILYFHLIEKVGVGNSITVAYLVPLFGVLWGALFLDETLHLSMFVGGGMILLGVALTTGLVGKLRRPVKP